METVSSESESVAGAPLMTSIGILRCVVGPYLCAVPCALPSRRFCATLPSRCARMASVSTDHKPFRISGAATDAADWVADLELDSASDFGAGQAAPRILVLYGSLRSRSYSRLLAFEFCRILEKLGAEVKVFDPRELPMHDTELHSQHPKVLARPALMRVSLVRLVPCVTRLDCDVHCPQELRSLSEWSEGQLWVSPEQHGAITGVMKARAQTAMCPLVRTPRLASRNRCVLLALRRSWTGFHCRWVAFDLRRGAPLPSPRSAHPRHICFEALQPRSSWAGVQPAIPNPEARARSSRRAWRGKASSSRQSRPFPLFPAAPFATAVLAAAALPAAAARPPGGLCCQVVRSCPEMCRFCLASYLTLPFRAAPLGVGRRCSCPPSTPACRP